MLLDRRWQDGRSPRGIDECRTVLIAAGIMAERVLEKRVENLEHRVATVEQILPTLATKADLAELRNATKADLAELRIATKADLVELRTAMKADLAELRTETKADLQAAIAPLATKAEVRAEIKAEGEQTRRHFDVVAEGIRSDVRLIAEGLAALQVSTDARHADVMGVLIQHDRRLTRLENPPKRRSPS